MSIFWYYNFPGYENTAYSNRDSKYVNKVVWIAIHFYYAFSII